METNIYFAPYFVVIFVFLTVNLPGTLFDTVRILYRYLSLHLSYPKVGLSKLFPILLWSGERTIKLDL